MAKSIKRLLIATLSVLTAVGLTASFAVLIASPAQAEVVASYWNCGHGGQANNGDANSADVGGYCFDMDSTDTQVSARFAALGEHFIVCDEFVNGHATFAQLSVEGNGTASFYTKGGGGVCDDFNLSFDEGLAVSIRVCTSDIAGAFCGGWWRGGIT